MPGYHMDGYIWASGFVLHLTCLLRAPTNTIGLTVRLRRNFCQFLSLVDAKRHSHEYLAAHKGLALYCLMDWRVWTSAFTYRQSRSKTFHATCINTLSLRRVTWSPQVTATHILYYEFFLRYSKRGDALTKTPTSVSHFCSLAMLISTHLPTIPLLPSSIYGPPVRSCCCFPYNLKYYIFGREREREKSIFSHGHKYALRDQDTT